MAVVTGDDEIAIASTEAAYVTSVHLLCAKCRAPIRGWINSPHWVRVEWISPDGECQACVKEKKERNG